MKKLLCLFSLAIASTLLVGGIAKAAPVTIKFAHGGSTEHQYHIGAEEF